MSYRPLFASGTARGGTAIIILAAGAHSGTCTIQDPYLGLFKSLRRALGRRSGLPNSHDLAAPLDEYYFFDDRLQVMDLIQSADLNLAFDEQEYPELRDILKERMKLAAPLLLPHIDRLEGDTYRELFGSAVDLVAAARNKPDVTWAGFNDNWTVEFFRPLARSFPDARFILIIRDVRAAIASHIRLVEAEHINPLAQYPKSRAMIAMTLSFARCWRKQIAFACEYTESPDMRDRVHLMGYENFVREPERRMRELCAFLELEYEDAMIDTRCFLAGDGNPWLPTSNHGDVPSTGIYETTVDRWRETLPPEILSLVELVAGPDLEIAGYSLSGSHGGASELLQAYQRHATEVRDWEGGSFGWRTDNDNPEIDISLELLRRKCLESRVDDDDLVRRAFLFPWVYEYLMNGKTLETH